MEKMINKFADIAIERWELLESGNSKKANKYFYILNNIVDELKNTDNITQLLVLLTHSDDRVKYEAASKLLLVVPDEAEKILVDISQKRGLLSFTAKQTLREWKNRI